MSFLRRTLAVVWDLVKAAVIVAAGLVVAFLVLSVGEIMWGEVVLGWCLLITVTALSLMSIAWNETLLVRWLPASADEPRGVIQTLAGLVQTLLILITAFAVITAVLFARGVIDLDLGRYTYAELGSSDVFVLAMLFAFYAYHFIAGIPVLELPETFALTEPELATAGFRGGLILLAFKLAVIAPIVGAIRELWRSHRTYGNA